VIGLERKRLKLPFIAADNHPAYLHPFVDIVLGASDSSAANATGTTVGCAFAPGNVGQTRGD
jgi:hypothetical protein